MKKMSLGMLAVVSVVLAALLVLTGCPAPATTTTPATTSPAPTVTSPVPTTTSPTTTATSPSPTATESPSPTATTSPSPTATASPSPSPTRAPLGSVEVLGVWGGDELTSFEAMVAPWEQDTGGTLNFTGTRDLIAVLTTRIQAGNPPDVAILPNPGQMRQLADAGELIALDTFLDMTTINQQYSQAWIDLGTVSNSLYAIFMKAANKGMIWHNPKTFTTNNWTVPATWDELIALSDQIVSAGAVPQYPWSIGIESAAATGWPATDWIAQIFLAKYGGDSYDQWVNHEIPWTNPNIKDAWEMFGTIVNTQGYVPGGATTALATNFQDASYLPFQDPPQAAMYYEGDFVQGFIATQFPNLVAGEDYSFFAFPTIDPQYEGAVTGGADLVVAFNDSETTRSFVSYLVTPEAQAVWVERGGFTSVNNDVSLDAYPNDLARQSAEQLINAQLFRFGAGDTMPSAVQTAWWQGVVSYLQNPAQLDSILANIESVAATAYQPSPTPTGTASPSPSP